MNAQAAQATQAVAPVPNGTPEDTPVPTMSGATFGVELGEQLVRDGREVPKIVEKCAEAIEAYGECTSKPC